MLGENYSLEAAKRKVVRPIALSFLPERHATVASTWLIPLPAASSNDAVCREYRYVIKESPALVNSFVSLNPAGMAPLRDSSHIWLSSKMSAVVYPPPYWMARRLAVIDWIISVKAVERITTESKASTKSDPRRPRSEALVRLFENMHMSSLLLGGNKNAIFPLPAGRQGAAKANAPLIDRPIGIKKQGGIAVLKGQPNIAGKTYALTQPAGEPFEGVLRGVIPGLFLPAGSLWPKAGRLPAGGTCRPGRPGLREQRGGFQTRARIFRNSIT